MRSDLAHVHQTSSTAIQDAQKPAWFDDDSDWEYEYAEDETEDYFFTVDLTTHVPDALTKRETAKNGRIVRGTMEARVKKTTTKKADKGSMKSAKAVDVGNRQDIITVDADATPIDNANQPPTDQDQHVEQGSDNIGTIQFIGLNTASPYLVYNDSFYSAYWLSDLGTQLWVSRPGISDSVIHKGHVLDVIGASQVRLMAKPAKLQARYENSTSDAMTSSNFMPITPVASDQYVYESSSNLDQPAQPLQIPASAQLDPVMRTHASFMERFSALKWKRGERDQVQLHSVKQYELPDNAEQIRAQALEADSEEPASKKQRLDAGRSTSYPASMPVPDTAAEILEPQQQISASTPGDDDEETGETNAEDEGNAGTDAEDEGNGEPNAEDEGNGEANAEDEGNCETNDEDEESGGDDADNEKPGGVNVDNNAQAEGSEAPVRELSRRGPRRAPKNAKLEALGLRDPDAPPEPKRKRRTKAEMEQAKAREEAGIIW